MEDKKNMEFSKKKNFFVIFILSLPFLLYFCFVPIAPTLFDFIHISFDKYHYITTKTYTRNYVYNTASLENSVVAPTIEEPPKKLEHPPAILKAIYATGWSAGSKNYTNYLNELLKTTQINAVVVDVKDSTGVVSYKTSAKKALQYQAYFPKIPDINELVRNLHDKGIYVIGRVAVFEDPMLAKNRPDLAIYNKSKTQDVSHPVLWQDNNGLSWVDPSSQAVYDYNIEIAKDALSHGFDEINFDYVRFPTDGDAHSMEFPVWDKKIPKNFVIKNFFKTLREAFPDDKISADLFGQTTSNTDDMGIGQIWEDSLSYFDYVCPMIYPSHYISGFLGYKNPAQNPYQIVKYALDSALARQKVFEKINNASNINALNTANALPNSLSPKPESQKETPKFQTAKIRPWLQDFNLGATYNADMIKQEIKAVTDSMETDFSGYMLWNASNIYTVGAIMLP